MHVRIQNLVLQRFFSHQRISKRAVLTLLEKHLDPKGSLTVFLRKPIASYEFPGVGCLDPMPPSGSAHIVFVQLRKCTGMTKNNASNIALYQMGNSLKKLTLLSVCHTRIVIWTIT